MLEPAFMQMNHLFFEVLNPPINSQGQGKGYVRPGGRVDVESNA